MLNNQSNFWLCISTQYPLQGIVSTWTCPAEYACPASMKVVQNSFYHPLAAAQCFHPPQTLLLSGVSSAAHLCPSSSWLYKKQNTSSTATVSGYSCHGMEGREIVRRREVLLGIGHTSFMVKCWHVGGGGWVASKHNCNSLQWADFKCWWCDKQIDKNKGHVINKEEMEWPLDG